MLLLKIFIFNKEVIMGIETINHVNDEPNLFAKEGRSYAHAYGQCFANEFRVAQITPELNTLTLSFPISHQVHKGHFFDKFTKKTPSFFSSNKQLESYLQLKFTLEGDHLFLAVESGSFINMYNYHLEHLLSIFAKNDESLLSSFALDQDKTIDGSRYFLTANRSIQYRYLKTLDDSGIKEIKINELISCIADYNLNCLKRFEELTCQREVEAYNSSKTLGLILNNIVDNFRSVLISDYKNALSLLDELEHNETYQNDPQIQLSMPKIKMSLEHLAKGAWMSGKGIEINMTQLDLVLKELEHHEGNKPDHGIWFPKGTVDECSYQLREFISCYYNVLDAAGI